jgi:predicted metal-binding protein
MKDTTNIYEKIEELVAEYGICEYRQVSIEDIIFSKNVRLLSEQECLENGESSWSMPPAVGTYEECLERCHQYQNALLFSTIFPADDVANIHEWMQAAMEHNRITLQMTEALKEDVTDILPLGVRCRRCERCAWPEAACRHPETLLPSTESYGIHIMETMQAQGITDFYDSHTIVCFGVILF